MFYIAGLFLVLMAGFAVIDFLEWREARKKKLMDEYDRSMLWAPKVKKG